MMCSEGSNNKMCWWSLSSQIEDGSKCGVLLENVHFDPNFWGKSGVTPNTPNFFGLTPDLLQIFGVILGLPQKKKFYPKKKSFFGAKKTLPQISGVYIGVTPDLPQISGVHPRNLG